MIMTLDEVVPTEVNYENAHSGYKRENVLLTNVRLCTTINGVCQICLFYSN
jgi:hypothetical protein